MNVGVNAAVRNKADQVDGFVFFCCVVVCRYKYRVVVERSFVDGFVDFDEILIDHASGADVHVSHFGVAHLSFRESHGET